MNGPRRHDGAGHDGHHLLRRLGDVRRLTAEVAAVDGFHTRLAALAAAALELTGFDCGQVHTREDGRWVGHGGARCRDAERCPACGDDPQFTGSSPDAMVLDRFSPAGMELLADAPRTLTTVMVTPVPVGPELQAVLVLGSGQPDAAADPLTLELVRMLTTRCAIAIGHDRTRGPEQGPRRRTGVADEERTHLHPVS